MPNAITAIRLFKVDTNHASGIDFKETPAIPIFAAGKWKGRTYSTGDLDKIAQNFHKLKEDFRPPLILGHDESEMLRRMAGLPALGRAVDVFREGEVLFAAFEDVPEELIQLIESGQYRDVSAGIYLKGFPDHPDTNGIGPILRHIAILGEEVPHLKVLGGQPLKHFLAASESDEFETVMLAEEIKVFQDDAALTTSKHGILIVMAKLEGQEAEERQSILFDKKRFDRAQAIEWLEGHNLASDKVDETANALRFRQKDPSEFQRDSFRVIEPGAQSEFADGAVPSDNRKEGVMPETKVEDTPAKETEGVELAETQLSRRLSSLLEDKEMTVAELAAAMNNSLDGGSISASTVGQIVRGEIETPSDPVMTALARALSVSKSSLEALLPAGKEPGEGRFEEEENVPKEEKKEPVMTAAEAEVLRNRADEMEAQFNEMKARMEAAEATAEKERKERTESEIAAFTEKLKADGRLVPANEKGVQNILRLLSNISEPQEFDEGAGEVAPYEYARRVFSEMPKGVELQELAKADETATKSTGIKGSAASIELHELAEKRVAEFAEKGQNITYTNALKQVAKENKDLANNRA